MLYPLIEAFDKIGQRAIRNDDFFDRLSRRYSMIILGVCFITVTTTYFVGNPIHCFTQLVDGHDRVDYINWVCWINSTYYLPFEKPLPNRNEIRPAHIHYYQWVPFILFSMMTLFYIPGAIWRRINKTCGIDTKFIMNILREMDPLSHDKRKEAMNSLVKHIDKALSYHRDYPHGFFYRTWRRFSYFICCTISKSSGNYLAAGYILVKILYIVNAVSQFLLLNVLLGGHYHLYGFEIIRKWYYGLETEAIAAFPRITICQFSLRKLGDNIQKYSVQCLLPINIYNEKVFLLIWFWLPFVCIASIYGLLKWFRYYTLTSRKDFLRRYFKANAIDYNSDEVTKTDPEILNTFINHYCRQDGLLLLRLAAENTNKVVAGELICSLWDHWRTQREARFPISPIPSIRKQAQIPPEYDGNQSTLTNFRVPISTIHEDRYMLSPLHL